MFDRQGNPATASREAIAMAAKALQRVLTPLICSFDLLFALGVGDINHEMPRREEDARCGIAQAGPPVPESLTCNLRGGGMVGKVYLTRTLSRKACLVCVTLSQRRCCSSFFALQSRNVMLKCFHNSPTSLVFTLKPSPRYLTLRQHVGSKG